MAHKKTQPIETFERIGFEAYVAQREQALERQTSLANEQQRAKVIRDERYNRLYQNVANQLQATGSNNPAAGKNLKDKMHVVKAMGRRFKKEDEMMVALPHPEEEMVLRLSQSISPKNGHPLLLVNIESLTIDNKVLSKDIHLEIDAGEKVAIVGDNGVGKTTLMNGLWQMAAKDKTLKSFYMPQDYSRLFIPNETAIAFVCNSSPLREEQEKAAKLLGLTGLLFPEMNTAVSNLSGGQKAKAIFARMAYLNSDFLLLDEPTRNISPLQLSAIRKMLKDFKGTLVFVTHDEQTVMEIADKVYRLTKDGLKELN